MIGNYSELNPKGCGITRFTKVFDSCFEYHRNSDPTLKAGRNATQNEVPWMVYIEISRGQRLG